MGMPSKSSPAFFGFTPATKHSRPFAYSRHIRVWNWPVLPVMPCVTTRVFLLIRIDIAGPSVLVDGSDDLLRRVGHVVGRDDRQTRVLQDLPPLLFVRSAHAHDERYAELHFLHRRDHAVRNRVAAHD